MISNFRTAVGVARAGSLAVLMTLCGVTVAGAEQRATALSSAAPSADQVPQPADPPPPGITGPAFWELIGGYEADTHGSGYGFFGPSYVHPFRPGLAWTARAFGNYLAYEFTGANGTTRVRSPGVSTAVGLRFGEKNFFGVSAGPEVKWQRTEVTRANGASVTSNETRLGANVGAELYTNPTSYNNIHGIVNYGTADEYTWARLGFKQQISNRSWQGPTTTFLGVEGIAQGNDDIRSTQFGGFFEITRVPAQVSLVFKAGYKRSSFDVGPNKTGPYFAVGFYQRLN